MPKKKSAPKKKKTSGKKPNQKKEAPSKRAVGKKVAAKKRAASKKKPTRRKKISTRSKAQITNPLDIRNRRGLGAASGGQSGDTQGLARREDVDSESVEELVEEGQSFEAEAVSGVENAKDPDQDEI